MRTWLRVIAALAGRPSLWPTVCRLGVRMVPQGWWRQFPFMPIPPRKYVQFRLVTQYGSTSNRVESSDVLNYVAWCKRQC